MATVSSAENRCEPGNTVCEVRVYQQEIIVVPVLLLASFLVTLVFLLLLRFCPERVDRLRPKAPARQRPRRLLQGIDAPEGINPMEHESIALDAPSYSTFAPSGTSSPLPYSVDSSTFARTSFTLVHSPPTINITPTSPTYLPKTPSGSSAFFSQPPELPRQRLPESFNLVTPLPFTFSLRSQASVSLYRAKMNHRNVILRVLKDSADANERQNFLGFASFLSQVGPHPFLPEIMGVVSLRAPLITVVEDLENRDLLSYLWRCRQDSGGLEDSCKMTEKHIFTMAKQVASALEYLHNRDLVHGNIRAHSILVSQQLTAKLWGFGTLYAKQSQGERYKEDPGMKKWHAPEVLARRPTNRSADIWSFGILLNEMVTLGDPPFPDISVNELLQFLQRGKSLKKPANCSNFIYSLIKACCQWKEQDRISLAEVIRKLESGEKSANDKVVLKAPEPINIEEYLQKAGYGDSNNYTVF